MKWINPSNPESIKSTFTPAIWMQMEKKTKGKLSSLETAWFLSKAPFDHSAQLHFPKFTDGKLWRTFDIDKILSSSIINSKFLSIV